jgi:tetratricopeptide (TPR) repeat protein
LGEAAAPAAVLLPPVPVTAAPFIGRAAHLAALQDAFGATREGRPVTVFVQGRSGTGKSLLVQHFLDDLLRRGEAVVLAGKCYERESVPYKALDGLVDTLSRHLRGLPRDEAAALLPREVSLLAEVFPVLGRVESVAEVPVVRMVDADQARRRAFAALRELLARLGRRQPLILFIDDLQWGDEDSAAQLAALLRPPNPPVLLLVASYRSEEAATSPCLRELLFAERPSEPGADRRHVTVEPLTDAEAKQLVRTLLGAEPPPLQAEAIARESAGNPFFVQVLVHRLMAGLANTAREAGAGGPTLDQFLWEQFQALPEDARRLLEVVAVSGQPLPQTEACQAAGLGKPEPKVLGVLRANRLLRGAGPTALEEVETYHDRIREAILARLPSSTRQGHHLRLAETFERSAQSGEAAGGNDRAGEQRDPVGRRSFDLAYHFDAAGDSRRALPYALAAAEQARSQHALRIAEQQYRIAERGAEDRNARCRVAEGLGDVLMLLGQYEETRQHFQAARSLAEGQLAQAQLEGKLGELAFKQGDSGQAVESFKRALRLLGKRVPDRPALFVPLLLWEVLVQVLHTYWPRSFLARRPLADAESDLMAVRLHGRLAQAYWFLRGRIPCLWSHLRAFNLAECYPPTLQLAEVYSDHAPVMTLLPNFPRGVAYSEKALAIRVALGDHMGRGQSLQFYGMLLHAASQFPACVAKCNEAIQLLDQTGDPWRLNCTRFSLAGGLYRLGDLRGAILEARRLHENARAIGDGLFAGVSLCVWAKASGGKVPAQVIRAELDRPSNDPQRQAQVMHAEAMRLLDQGCPGDGAEVLEQAQRLVQKARIRNGYVSPLLPWLATMLRLEAEKTGNDPSRRKTLLRRAGAAARRGLRLARTFQNDLPHALRENALLAALWGRPGRARRFLDESLAVAQRQGARYEYAQTRLARAQTGQRFGWPEAAADVVAARQALDTIEATRKEGSEAPF